MSYLVAKCTKIGLFLCKNILWETGWLSKFLESIRPSIVPPWSWVVVLFQHVVLKFIVSVIVPSWMLRSWLVVTRCPLSWIEVMLIPRITHIHLVTISIELWLVCSMSLVVVVIGISPIKLSIHMIGIPGMVFACVIWAFIIGLCNIGFLLLWIFFHCVA